MDVLQLAIELVTEDEGKTRPVVAISINGRPLFELARVIEMPFAMVEGDEPDLAGGYIGLPPVAIFFPSRRLLGEPDDEYDFYAPKIALGDCPCGLSCCWPLLARIEVSETMVVWCDFEQPNRAGPGDQWAPHWTYDELGPFVFDRQQYQEQLSANHDGAQSCS